jgi:hypothetical protein
MNSNITTTPQRMAAYLGLTFVSVVEVLIE